MVESAFSHLTTFSLLNTILICHGQQQLVQNNGQPVPAALDPLKIGPSSSSLDLDSSSPYSSMTLEALLSSSFPSDTTYDKNGNANVEPGVLPSSEDGQGPSGVVWHKRPQIQALAQTKDPSESAEKVTASTASQYVDVCIGSDNHKEKPGPEPDLHGQCKLWADKACCTEKTTRLIHNDPQLMVYGFNFSHCQPLSPKCVRFFRQEFCFLACSPNVGPWIDFSTYPIGRARFHRVPLCAHDCQDWFNACSEDLTCVADWFQDFDWDSGSNVCPSGSTCRPLRDVYGNAKTFCETVWSGQWRYEDQSSMCLQMWFDPGNNPNANVAAHHAERLVRSQAQAGGGHQLVVPDDRGNGTASSGSGTGGIWTAADLARHLLVIFGIRLVSNAAFGAAWRAP